MSTPLAVHHGPFGRVALYALDRSMVTHAHREGHLLFHLDGPDASIPVEGKPLPLDRRNAVAVSPWQPHGFTASGRGATLILILYIRPAWFVEASRRVSATLRFGRNTIAVTAPLDRLVAHAVRTLLDDRLEPDLLEQALAGLTEEAFDQSWQWRSETGCSRTYGLPVWDYRIRRSMRLMQDRVGEEVVLDGIARDAGLSRPHFYKLFRQQVGVTPNLYLNTLRMERAIERLIETSEPVTEIGFDLGFASQASFSRFFIANVGIPPSDYRRSACCRVPRPRPAPNSRPIATL
jgi:AraC-like DNA-binding protein